MITTVDDLIAYYQNLLIIQYKTLVKATSTIAALATEVVASMIYTQVQDGFNLDSAIGVQLDTLGAYVGAYRFLANFTFSNNFMAYPLYSNVSASSVVGFSSYSDVTPPIGYWKLYSTTGASLTMSDGELQLLTKYMIAVHASDMTISSIDLILQTYFGTYATLTDNLDMTITYTHNSLDTSQLFSIVEFIGALPKPAGVGVNVVTI